MEGLLVFPVLLLLTVSGSNAGRPAPESDRKSHNVTGYGPSSLGTFVEALQFMFPQNYARFKVGELPLVWDFKLENYARWWAEQRKADCNMIHSHGPYGENIFWGSGSAWSPRDAVRFWVEEEQYYSYDTNSCVPGEMCGHYTQIVWRNSRSLGCARVVCDNGDVFMTCNYDPPGNYIGEKPY